MQAHYLPLCAVCQFGKQRQRPSSANRSSVVNVKRNLKKDKLFPRQCIAVDHYICSTKGRLFTSRGKTKDTDMYMGGALLMDMSSKQVENVFQQHLNTHETLKAKQDFELKCKMLELSLWRHCPSLQFLPNSMFRWSWHTSPQWSCREGKPVHHVHCKNYDAPLIHTLA